MTEPRRHPLSQDFVWEDRRPDPPRRLTPAQLDAFSEQGFVKLESVFAPAEIAAVTAAIDPLEKKAEAKLREAGGRISISDADAITFTAHISKKSDVLRDFARHPAILDICHDLVGDDVSAGEEQGRHRDEDGSGQDAHRDSFWARDAVSSASVCGACSA